MAQPSFPWNQNLFVMREFQLLNRKKTDPGKFIFTGESRTATVDIQQFRYNSVEVNEELHLTADAVPQYQGNHYHYWLNVHGLGNPDLIASICLKQDIHGLVIQDILDVQQRPKFQEFEHYCFLTIKSTIPASADMHTEQISFVWGKNYLISFQEKKSDHFEHLRVRLRENTGIIRERGADYLLFTMLEAILDNYFKTLQKLDDQVEQLNFLGAGADPSPDVLAMIERNKKYVHIIRKSILPVKEFVAQLERVENKWMEKRHLKYYLEIKDLCLTLLDNCDMISASLESKSNLFFSVQGHRLNQVMKTLTVVTAIFIPLSFIAGVYGMNFAHMPELKWKYGYPAVLVIMFALLVIMLIIFRKRKWL